MCPSESIILAFVQGESPPEERADVERHMASCEECRMLVSAMARSTIGPRSGPASVPAVPHDVVRATADTSPAEDDGESDDGERAAPRAPVTIGTVVAEKYRIDEVLGAGGMGIVMAATHLGLGQRVALKFLVGPAATTRSARARLMREARAAASLESEHSVRVTDVGSLGDGTPYLVMELLRGSDLGRLLEDAGPLPIELALDVTLQACDAVAEAHGRGIIHRDLKPANLFLAERSDGTRIVKVLDFGISKFESAGEAQITTSDVMIGSPRYMSPEQMVSSRMVDTRTDIWSLGVVLFELVTARPPFEADTVAGLCAVVATANAPDVRTYRKDAPERLAEIIRKCLAKEPQHRYGSVGELAEELRELSSPAGQRTVDRLTRGASAAPVKSAFEATTASSSRKKPARMIVSTIGLAALAAVGLFVVVRMAPERATGVVEAAASSPSLPAAMARTSDPVVAPQPSVLPIVLSATSTPTERPRVGTPSRPMGAEAPAAKPPKRASATPVVPSSPASLPAPAPDHAPAVPETKSSGLIDRK